jgi:hypothetical protein
MGITFMDKVNAFLNVYCVYVLRGSFKLKVIARLVDRSNSLKVGYQTSLAKVGIHLVSLQEL